MMHKKRFRIVESILLFTVLLLAPLSLSAQSGPSADTNKAKTSVQVGFNLARGNTDTTLLTMKATGEISVSEKNSIPFDYEQGYGDKDSEKSVDFTKLLLGYERKFSKDWYVNAQNEFFRDEIAAVKYREIPALIVGYYFSNEKPLILSAGLGPAYVFEHIGELDENYAAPRFEQKCIYSFDSGAKFHETLSGFFQIDDVENYFVRVDIGIETPITDFLALHLTLTNLYDNEPAENKLRNDTRLISALGIKF
ncbi:DUF481 domain-containing protein [bacterium]|nr:DUF481 domain-containing protein [bacterium]